MGSVLLRKALFESTKYSIGYVNIDLIDCQ